MNDEPLNTSALKLMEREKAEPSGLGPSDEAAARVLKRLESAGLMPPEVPGSPSTPSAGAPTVSTGIHLARIGAAVSLLGIGAAMGSAATLWFQHREPVPAVENVPEQTRGVPAAPPPVQDVPLPAPVIPPVVVRPKVQPESTLRQEQVLLDTARTALINQRPQDALVALDRHTRNFPSGELSEQREVLAVQALSLSGDVAAARERSIRFKKQYPRSVFLPAVEAATP